MGIENVKRWQWAMVGLLAGLLFAFSWMGREPDSDEHLSQMEFEREVQSKSRQTGKPLLQDIVVRPAVEDFHKRDDVKVQLVTGMRLRYSPKDKKEFPVPFAYIAPMPYRPEPERMGGGPKASSMNAPSVPGVMDYLASIQKTHPDLHYRFAWEAKPTTNLMIGAGAGLLVIGGIWPTLLHLLINAGLGKAPKTAAEDEYDLSRFGKGKQTVPGTVKPSTGWAEQDRQRLNALNETLEAQLAAAGIVQTDAPAALDDSGAGMAPPAGAGVRSLTEGPAEPAVIAAQEHAKPETYEELKKKYDAGVFYPVAHGDKKKT